MRQRWALSLALLAAALLPPPARATVDSALSQARSWLIAQQNPDGSFGAGAELLPRDSAAAVLALTGGPADAAIGRGADYLAALPETTAYYRALRVQALARAGSSFTALIATLDEFRNGEGMGAFGSYYSNLFDTTQAIEAYAEEESAHQLDIVPLLDYLRTSQAADGGWGYLPGNPSQVYYTGEALWAATRLHTLAVTPQFITNSRAFLISKLQSNGTFGSALETAVAYRALVGSGYVFTAAQPDVVAALLAAQRPDGSWDGDAYTTAEVVRALATYRPNLVIAALTAPANASAGATVQVSVTVQNVGPQAAAASRLVLRAGSATSSDVRAEAAVPALNAGATSAVTLPVATVGDSGELVLYAVADAGGAVAEQSELDNARSVRIALTGRANLAVFPANFSLAPVRPQPLTPFSILATVQNLGEQPVTSFGYRLTRVVAGVPVQTLLTGNLGLINPGASLLLTVANVSLAEGEQTVRLELDPAAAITESSEEDNLAEYTFFVVDDTLADFAVADADFTTLPADAVPGQAATVSLVVRNNGNQAGLAVVDFFDGDSTTGTPVLTLSQNLNPNTNATLTGSYTPQASSVVMTAVVDGAGSVSESDENNNRARHYLRQLPDLAVGYDSVTLTPAAPLAGDTTTVRINVRNAGSLVSTAAPVALFAGLPEAGGVEVGRATVGAIAAAGNAGVEIPWTAAGGATNLVVVVDPDGAMLERSEANNRTVRRITVQRAAGPNLVVSAVDLTQVTHSALDLKLTGTIGLTVANQGTAATAGAYLVRLFEDRDGDRRFAAPDRDLASTVLDQPLAAGATTPVTFTVDATLAFAHALVLAEADSLDTIAETREDDNQRALFGDCEEAAPAAGIEPVEKWWVKDVDVQSAPVVVQLSDDNGDGLIDSRDNPDVVTHASDAQGRMVLAVSGLDGSQLWAFRSTAANPLGSEKANVSAVDLDGDGVVEILAVQTNSKLLALDNKGLVRWTSETIESTGGDWRGGSAVGDLTGDGVPEIVVGRAVLSNTGKRIAVGTANAARNNNYYGPFGSPYLYDQQHAIIADVDLDGRNEIVAGDTVYRLVDGVLTVVWDWVEHDNMLKDGFSAVGNLDADPYPEIVYVSAGFVKVIQHDGAAQTGSYARIVPVFPPIGPDTMVTFWGGPPTIADLTGDGVPEILVAGDTHLTAFNAGLGVLWRKPTFDYAAMTGVTAFDLDGDGKREVIYNDETSLFILDGMTGAVRYQRKNTSLTGTELPVVADLDNDGVAEILMGSSRDRYGDLSTRGLHVFGHPGWRGTRAIWNEHSYHVTNVQLDGTVPAHEAPSWQLTNTFRTNLELPRPPRRLLPNVTIGLPRLGAAGAQGIPVTLRIGNGGAAPVGAGVEITLAAQSGGPVVGSARTRTALGPGDWEDVTVYWQSATTAPVEAVAVVDPSAKVDECDTSDNTLDFTVEERLLPDLAIPASGITVTGATTAGQLIDFAVQVKNHGPAASPATVVRVTDGVVALGEAAVPTLAPSTNTTVTVRVDTLLLAAGLHSFHVDVDPDDLVPEVDEDNNGGLVQLTLAAATKPDLVATTLTVTPAAVAAGTSSTLSVEILNRGTALVGGFQVSFRVNGGEVSKVTYPGQLDNAGRVTLIYELSTLGRQGTLQITAVADPASLISEVSETNNTATASLVVTASPISLLVSSDKPRYKPTETAQVTVAVTNGSTQPVTGSLRVVLQGATGAEVALIGDRPVTLPTGGSVQAFSFSAASALPAPYFAVATFTSDGVAVAVGQTSFSVIADVALQAQIASNQAIYKPSSTVFLTGGVRNVATSTLVAGAVADLSILNPGGQSVFHQTSALGQLLPGGFVPVAGTWPVGNAAPGVYRVELRVSSSLNELLALATSNFRVESTGDTGAGVHGSVNVTPTLQGVGGSLAVEYALENRGNAPAPSLVIHLEMLALATGEPVRTLDVPMPLLAGESAAGRWRIQTAGLAPSQYLVSLSAVTDGAMSPLGSALVTLLPGLLVDDLSLHEGDSGTHTAQVTVRLQPATDKTVTVEFSTADGSATSGEDYDATSGTLTFAPGETSKAIDVEVHGDTDEELHETLLVNLTDSSDAWIADGQAVVTLEDEEGCASTDLLQNGGGEEMAVDGTFAGWTGTGWEGGYASPQPFVGDTYFLARAGSALELVQEVSLAPFASRIDAGGQAFVFEGFVAADLPAARVVVDYLDALGQVLDSFDSGALGDRSGWQAVVDRRVAPAGTREVRVHLRGSGEAAAAFDRLAVRSLGVVTLFAADASVAESAPNARVTLALSCAADTPLSVAFQTADLEALAGQDYTAKTGTASFAAGEVAATVDVVLLQDAVDEEDERFQLGLTSGDVIVLTNPAIVTLLDDDGAVMLEAEPAAVSEGDAGTVDAVFALTLSQPSGREVKVNYATTAQSAAAGSDFVATSGTVTFPVGTTEREVHVAVKGDLVDELAETFRLTLSSPQNVTLATTAATGTIVDDDTASITAVDVEVVESDSGTVNAQVPVRLSMTSDRAVQVAYTTVAGTATSPADFTATSGTLTFPAGSTQQTIAVPIVGETLEEVTESFLVMLSNPQNADLGDPEATVTIVDEDGPVFAIADVTVTEGNSGTRQAVFTISSLKSPADVIWVDDDVPTGASVSGDSDGGWFWVTTNPPPFSGTRSHQSALLPGIHQHLFTGASNANALTVSAGDYLIAYVYLDPTTPPTEVMLQWNDGSGGWEHRAYWGANSIPFGANGTNSRRFMGALPATGKWVRLEVPASLVGLEGRTLNGMAFTLSGGRATWDHAGKGQHYDAASVRTVTMDVTTADGTAVAGADYVPLQTTLTFAPGETAKTVIVDVIGEKVEEPDETFTVRLEHPVNTALQRAEAIGTILDDDVFTITAADLYLVESKPSAPLKLTLNRASEDPITVRVTTVDDVAVAGQDYTSTAETVTFAPGTTVQTVPIPLLDDAAQEGPERFWVDLSDVTIAHLARTRVGVHLLDDEKPASYPLATTVRDFKASHPDIHTCSSAPRPAIFLAADGKPAYGSAGTGAANFAQWYHDTVGVNLDAGVDVTLTKNAAGTLFQSTPTEFLPIDGKLFGNEGSHNYNFTSEMHAWFTYEPGATFGFASDDDGWCFINNQLAIDKAGCHGASTSTVTLSSIAATHGLVPGESYRVDCFQAERAQGTAGFYFESPLYLQQFEPGMLQIMPQGPTVAEGATAPLQVERVGGYFGTVTATAASSGGTATPNVDFTAVNVPIVRTNGQKAVVAIPVATTNDTAAEGEETVRLDLLEPYPPSIVGPFSTSTLRLVDDESLPVPTLLSPVVSEGYRDDILMVPIVLQGQNLYGVTLSYATQNGTAIANSDYQATSGTLTFPVGVTRALLNIRTFGDATVEADETLDVVFTGAGILGGSARVTLTLANDDGCATPNLVQNPSFDQVHSTPTTVPFWTTVVGDWVYWTQGGYDGSSGYAYAQSSPFGELYQDVDVSAFAPFVDQGGKRFAFRTALWSGDGIDRTQVILEFRNASKQLISSFDLQEWLATSQWGVLSTVQTVPAGTRFVRIRGTSVVYSTPGSQNNAHFDGVILQALGVPSLLPVDRNVDEGQAGTTAAPVTVNLACTSTSAVTVDWSTVDVTARAGEDYQAAIGTLTIPAGSSAGSIPLNVLGDTISEGTETFKVRLQTASGAVIVKPEATVTINDDETKLSILGDAKDEGNSGITLASVKVSLDKAITLPVTVDYRTEGSTATAGEDFVAVTGTLTFAPGEKDKTISIQILGDTTVEPDEELTVVLSNPSNAAINGDRATVKIRQDDIPLTISDATVVEGDLGTTAAVFAVSLPQAATGTVTVSWSFDTLNATPDVDYVVPVPATLTFSPGQTRQTITIQVKGDTLVESGEVFYIHLFSPQNAFLGDDEAIGTIADDDDCPSPNLLANPSGELPLVVGEISGWTEVKGTTWDTRTVSAGAVDGVNVFFAGSAADAELRQDVDVSAYAPFIDAGAQRFLLQGFVRSAVETPADPARIALEFLDAGKGFLDGEQSPEYTNVSNWQAIPILHTAPAGTRYLRVRLLARRLSPGNLDAYFDGFSLRSLTTPVVTINDRAQKEGNAGTTSVSYTVRLSCAATAPVSIPYQATGTNATVGSDFLATSGTLTLAVGETSGLVRVPIVGDTTLEADEGYIVTLGTVTGPAVLNDGTGLGTIVDDDGDKLTLVGTIRDFTTAHPDFESALGSDPGIVTPLLGDDQKPIYAGQAGNPTTHGQAAFDQWYRDVPGVNLPTEYWIRLTQSGSIYSYSNSSFFPIDNQLFNNQGLPHNYHFTYEIHTSFTYHGGEVFTFSGDDDVWVYINRRLVVDLGGVHGSLSATINLDSLAASIGLVREGTYAFDFFFAERHTSQSNFRIDTTIALDRSQPGTIQLAAAAQSIGEAAGQALVTATRTGGSDGRVTVDYAAAAGSATAGQDFTPVTGTLVWEDGDDTPKTFAVPILDDTIVEPNETVLLQLQNPGGGAGLGTPSEGTLLILDDDARPALGATKTDTLVDADGDGAAGPGDTLEYRIVVSNSGTAAASNVVVSDTAPVNTSIVAGSATTTAGTIQTESPLQVLVPQLAIGSSVTITFRVRLAADIPADVTQVSNQGSVAATGVAPQPTDDPDTSAAADATVTPVVNKPRLVAEKTYTLAEDRDHSGGPSPGDVIAYTVVIENAAGRSATAVVFRDVVPPLTSVVAGSVTTDRGTVTTESPVEVAIGTLAVGASATVRFQVAIQPVVPLETTEISNQGMVLSAELPTLFTDDPAIAGTADPTVTPITLRPRLVAEKTVVLTPDGDSDGDGHPSPGDTLTYTVRVRNVGLAAATGVIIHDETPVNTTFVAGSATLSVGTLGGVDPIVANVGALAVDAETVLELRVRIVSPIDPSVREVSNQATVESAELDDVLSDDPGVPGVANPAVTPIVAAPVLALSKTDALHTDPNHDGYASPGEVVLYQLTLTNTGNTAATNVVLSDPLPSNATLEAGSLQTSAGTATEGDPVQVAVGTLAVGDTVTVSFRVRIAEPFPAGETEIVNQASVAATGLAAVPSDDPATVEPRDATRTPVVRLVDLSVADVSVGEAAGSATFVVTLSEASTVPVTVGYSVAAGSATAGADFTAVADTLTIPAGQLQGTIAVPVLDDTLDEPDETFTLTLADPVGALIADGSAVGTIVDDDAPPSLSIADTSVGEGDSGTTPATFMLTLSAPSAFAITVDYSTATGTAGGVDFSAASGTVSFAPGELSRAVTVNVLGDLLDEEDETFTISLANPQQVVLARNAAVGTIVDDDAPPTIAVDDVAVDEGNSGTVDARFTVTLSAVSGREVRVAYTTADVEAVAGVDFQATSGELVIAAGTISATVTVPVIGDLLDEADERFELRLSQPVNGTFGDAVGVGTIRDDDTAPTLSVGDVTVQEGDSGFTTVDVPVRLSAASGFVVAVAFNTADGTATSTADYVSAADTAAIPAGTTEYLVTLQVRGDLLDEADETFELRLGTATNATVGDGAGTVTILDDDAPVQVSIGDAAAVTEGDVGTRPATFTVTLAPASLNEVRVRYTTANGTATAGADFTATTGELTFAPGTTTQTVEVPVVGDLLLESDETLEVRLSAPVGADIGDGVGTGTIVDDETCQGPELVFNGGAEARPATGNNQPGWTPLDGTTWTRVSTPAAPAGSWSFSAPVSSAGELRQDVDLRAFTARAAGGSLRFAMRGAVLATGAANTASGHVVLELRDETNAAVLLTQDLGTVGPGTTWTSQLQVVTAPAGTGWARLRLLSKRTVSASKVYFDGISLRSLRVPVVTVGDMATYEGDSGQHDGVFQLLLACPYDQPVTADYTTADGTAAAGADYLTRSGEATFAPGTTSTPVPVPVLGDELYEGHERFTLRASNVEGGDAVLLDPTGEGLILDDDFCPRSPGYWKNHPEDWPVTFVVIGGIEYDKSQAMTILGYGGSDAATHLARQLIATKLNLLVGGDPAIVPAADAADAFLVEHPAGSNPGGAARDQAEALKAPLEAYNTTACTGVTPRW